MPVNTIRGRDASGSDNVLTDNLSTGLDVPEKLPTLMIVGALCNPLLQNGARMVASTLCTHAQLEDGMNHLHAYVKEYYEQLEDDTVPMVAVDRVGKTNKYDVPTNPDRTCRDSPAIKATKEINQFFANNNFRFLPKMKGVRRLGVVDARGQPKEPEYELGPVIERGDDFHVCGPNKLNHADFILPCGYFDICQFYEATRFLYPGLANTFLGKLGHHSCQEADCETLFSMSGYKSEGRRLNSLCRTYERLVIASHRMHRFHIRDQVIIDAFMDRVRNKDWDDEENRDDEEFLKLEEELWSKMYPEQANAVEAGAEGVVDENLVSIVDNQPANEIEAEALCAFFEECSNGDELVLPFSDVV